MASVNTVLGQVAVEHLGVTLTHEHVITGSAAIWETYPEMLGADYATLAAEAAESLASAHLGGVKTIVDVTTMDLGRNVRFLEEVSQRSGVNIIAATGCWLDPPRTLYRRSADEVAQLFIREITFGVDGTSIRAGVIKAATDQRGVTPEGEMILRAAARAAKATGVPLLTHTYAPGQVGVQQLAVFEQEGLPPDRVCIGHSNDTTDLAYLTGLARRGCYLGLDRFPGEIGPTWLERADLIIALIEAGFGRRILLSHDWAVLLAHTFPPREGYKRNPDGYLFLHRNVLPRLKARGIGDEILEMILVENPREFLGRLQVQVPPDKKLQPPGTTGIAA